MADPSISEIKYLGGGTLDFLEVRIPITYPDPENLRLVIYDRNHDGSTTQSPVAADIHNVTADGLLYTEDVAPVDGVDDDGVLHYTFGTSENGTNIKLHAEDAVGLYNVVTGQTYGLYNWDGAPYTVSTATGDPFAGQTATLLDNTGQVTGVTSLEQQPDGSYTLQTSPGAGSSFVCFTSGTLILTPGGERPVEQLRPGDSVITKDFGVQTIRWIGTKTFEDVAPGDTYVQPVVIRAHAFGPGLPQRDTAVSPNHMVLNDHWRAALYFGDDEVLTAAKHLVAPGLARRASVPRVTYVHILLDQHNLIRANGLWSESLYLGSQCMEMLGNASREEVFTLFPQCRGNLGGYGPKARHELRAREVELLVA
ncbi:MAG: Hint domain-containing protein [Pseudomonadota bacterium]